MTALNTSEHQHDEIVTDLETNVTTKHHPSRILSPEIVESALSSTDAEFRNKVIEQIKLLDSEFLRFNNELLTDYIPQEFQSMEISAMKEMQSDLEMQVYYSTNKRLDFRKYLTGASNAMRVIEEIESIDEEIQFSQKISQENPGLGDVMESLNKERLARQSRLIANLVDAEYGLIDTELYQKDILRIESLLLEDTDLSKEDRLSLVRTIINLKHDVEKRFNEFIPFVGRYNFYPGTTANPDIREGIVLPEGFINKMIFLKQHGADELLRLELDTLHRKLYGDSSDPSRFREYYIEMCNAHGLARKISFGIETGLYKNTQQYKLPQVRITKELKGLTAQYSYPSNDIDVAIDKITQESLNSLKYNDSLETNKDDILDTFIEEFSHSIDFALNFGQEEIYMQNSPLRYYSNAVELSARIRMLNYWLNQKGDFFKDINNSNALTNLLRDIEYELDSITTLDDENDDYLNKKVIIKDFLMPVFRGEKIKNKNGEERNYGPDTIYLIKIATLIKSINSYVKARIQRGTTDGTLVNGVVQI